MTDQNKLRSEADAVIEQTLLGVKPVELSADTIYAVRTPDGFQTIDLTKEEVLKAAGFPRSLPSSSFSFHSIESFTSYVAGVFAMSGPDQDFGYAKDKALCIADEDALTIRLIFDAQPKDWGTVYADLKLQHSAEVHRWLVSSGKYLAQQDFAEFCEINLESFSSPDAATILEIAQTFQAKTTVDFSSAVRLASGAIKLKREEQTTATAGERAEIAIPEVLTLALPLFKYGKAYAVKARLRYRVVESAVKLSVLLVDPEMAFEHAFKEVVSDVQERLNLPVFYGKV